MLHEFLNFLFLNDNDDVIAERDMTQMKIIINRSPQNQNKYTRKL